MSDSDGRANSALRELTRHPGVVMLFGAALALLALGLSAFMLSQSDHREERQNAARYSSEYTVEQIQAECTRVSRTGSFSCVANVPEAGGDEQYTRSDLEAQQEMAEWALAMFFASAIGALVTFAGVVYVALTLHETRVMSREAANATAAAEAAVTAANLGNNLAILTSRRQLRAYVGVSEMSVLDFSQGSAPKFVCVFKNYGATPARDLEIVTFALGCNDPETHKVRVAKDKREMVTFLSKIDLGPGQPSDQSFRSEVSLNGPMMTEFNAGKGTFLFCGVARYRDIFGERHWTIFRAYLKPDNLNRTNGVGTLSATRKHNRAN